MHLPYRHKKYTPWSETPTKLADILPSTTLTVISTTALIHNTSQGLRCTVGHINQKLRHQYRATRLSAKSLDGTGEGDSLVVGYSLMAHWVAGSSLAVGMSLEMII